MKNSFIQSWPVIFLVVILGVVIFLWRQSTSSEQLYITRTEMELQTRARLLSRTYTRYTSQAPWKMRKAGVGLSVDVLVEPE